MPLTAFQASVLALLAPQRSDVSYLAGGAALHIGPAGERFSDDLDFFTTRPMRRTSASRLMPARCARVGTRSTPSPSIAGLSAPSCVLMASPRSWTGRTNRRGAFSRSCQFPVAV